MDKATMTMIENLQKSTGKSLEQWIDIVKSQNFPKHGDALKFLKETHQLTHGYANLIAHKAKDSNSVQQENPETLIDQHYLGKEHFKPLYNKLITEIRTFGNDFEIVFIFHLNRCAHEPLND
jgi:hypothetical protein